MSPEEGFSALPGDSQLSCSLNPGGLCCPRGVSCTLLPFLSATSLLILLERFKAASRASSSGIDSSWSIEPLERTLNRTSATSIGPLDGKARDFWERRSSFTSVPDD